MMGCTLPLRLYVDEFISINVRISLNGINAKCLKDLDDFMLDVFHVCTRCLVIFNRHSYRIIQ
jgi:hypothetical protein